MWILKFSKIRVITPPGNYVVLRISARSSLNYTLEGEMAQKFTLKMRYNEDSAPLRRDKEEIHKQSLEFAFLKVSRATKNYAGVE